MSEYYTDRTKQKLDQILKKQIFLQRKMKKDKLPPDFLERFIYLVLTNSYRIGEDNFLLDNEITKDIDNGNYVLHPYSLVLFYLLSIINGNNEKKWNENISLLSEPKSYQIFALKNINSDIRQEEQNNYEKEQRKMINFFREIVINTKLIHPLINQCYEFNTIKQQFVSQYQIFGSLQDLIYLNKKRKNQVMYLSDKFRILYQATIAIEYVHSLNLIHRDLKPQNIFIDENMNIKIGDFGFARVDTNGKEVKTRVGTIHFLAPEIMNPENNSNVASYTKRIDTHSLALTAIYLFTTIMPYDRGNKNTEEGFYMYAKSHPPYFLEDLRLPYHIIDKLNHFISREIKSIQENKNRQGIENSQEIKNPDMAKFRDLLKDIAKEIDDFRKAFLTNQFNDIDFKKYKNETFKPDEKNDAKRLNQDVLLYITEKPKIEEQTRNNISDLCEKNILIESCIFELIHKEKCKEYGKFKTDNLSLYQYQSILSELDKKYGKFKIGDLSLYQYQKAMSRARSDTYKQLVISKQLIISKQSINDNDKLEASQQYINHTDQHKDKKTTNYCKNISNFIIKFIEMTTNVTNTNWQDNVININWQDNVININSQGNVTNTNSQGNVTNQIVSPFFHQRTKESNQIFINDLTAFATTLCCKFTDKQSSICNIYHYTKDEAFIEYGQYYITNKSVCALSYEYGLSSSKEKICSLFEFESEFEYELINKDETKKVEQPCIDQQCITIREIISCDVIVYEKAHPERRSILVRKNTPLDTTAVIPITGSDLVIQFGDEKIAEILTFKKIGVLQLHIDFDGTIYIYQIKGDSHNLQKNEVELACPDNKNNILLTWTRK